MKKSYAKYANIYDLDGTLINHVKEDGRLHDLTIEEVEALVDRLGEDKDENGNIRRKREFDNASMILFQMYQKYGNPHEQEIIKAVKEAAQKKTSESEIQSKINEVVSDLEYSGDNVDGSTTPTGISVGDETDAGLYASGQGIYVQASEDTENAEEVEYVEYEEIA